MKSDPDAAPVERPSPARQTSLRDRAIAFVLGFLATLAAAPGGLATMALVKNSADIEGSCEKLGVICTAVGEIQGPVTAVIFSLGTLAVLGAGAVLMFGGRHGAPALAKVGGGLLVVAAATGVVQ